MKVVGLILLLVLFAQTSYALHCRNFRTHFRNGRGANVRCPNGWVMRGIHRTRTDNLSGVNYIQCCRLPTNGRFQQYTANWIRSFDRRGWSNCRSGYFMSGLVKSSGVHIYNLEHAHCAKRTHVTAGHCYQENSVVGSLDRPGWSYCRRHGYFMAGMWRNTHKGGHAHRLHRIEYFRCCKPVVRRVRRVNHGNCRNIRIHLRNGRSSAVNCPSGYAMKGVHRNRVDNLSGLNYIKCCKLPGNYRTSVYRANWVRSFDRKGWSKCRHGYLMRGFYKSSGVNIYNLEHAYCSTKTHKVSSCYTETSVVGALDRPGWAVCRRNGYYMAGMWRNTHGGRHAHRLHRIEYFHCCKPTSHKPRTRRSSNVVCKNVRVKKCKRVRVRPYHKNVKRRVRYRKRVKYYVKRRRAVRVAKCRKRNVRVKYRKPYKTKVKVAYSTRKPYKKYFWKTKVWYTRHRKSKLVVQKKKYFVTVKRRFKVSYKKWKVKLVNVNYRSICRKTITKRHRKRVKYGVNSRCPHRVRVTVMKKRKVWVTKIFKKKVFTGRYRRAGKNNCFKKVYGTKYYKKNVKVWKRVPVKVWKNTTKPCIKYRYKWKYWTTKHVRRFRCTKRKRVPKKYFVMAVKYITKKVREVRYKNIKKRFYYWTSKRNTKRIRYSRTFWKRVTHYKYVWGVRYRDAYKTVERISSYYVTQYRTYQVAKYKWVHAWKYVIRRVSAHHYGNKCWNSSKRVCVTKRSPVSRCRGTPAYLNYLKFTSAASARNHAIRRCRHSDRGVFYGCVYDHSRGIFHTKNEYALLARLQKRAKDNRYATCYSWGDPHNKPFIGRRQDVYNRRGWTTYLQTKNVRITGYLDFTPTWKRRSINRRVDIRIDNRNAIFGRHGRTHGNLHGWRRIRNHAHYKEWRRNARGMNFRVTWHRSRSGGYISFWVSTRMHNVRNCSGNCCNHENRKNMGGKCVNSLRLRGWQDYGHGYQGATFEKRNGEVHISGLIKNGGSFIGQLPSGYRPHKRLIFTVNNHGHQVRVDILRNGQIHRVTGHRHGWLSLSGISFKVGTPRHRLHLRNGWRDYGHTYQGARFYKQNGEVHVSGLVRSAGSHLIGILPNGYRPHKRLIFSVNNHQRQVRVDVLPNGQIHRVTGNHHGWISLTGINFAARGSNGRRGLSLGGGWRNYGHSYGGATFRKVNGQVYVQGLIRNGRGYVARLPHGYRPKKRLIFVGNNHGRQVRLDVLPDGQIHRVTGHHHGWISLSNINFSVGGCKQLRRGNPYTVRFFNGCTRKRIAYSICRKASRSISAIKRCVSSRRNL